MSNVIKLNKSVEKGKTVAVEPAGFFIADFGLEGDRHGGKVFARSVFRNRKHPQSGSHGHHHLMHQTL